jgi:hypothetical protein
VPPQTRAALQEGFGRLQVVVNWMFLAPMLHAEEEVPTWVPLTTTEREFMHQSVYDDLGRPGGPGGHSLHYLDAEQRTVTTFRGLHLVHPPPRLRRAESAPRPGRQPSSPENGGICPSR